ncbi:DNA topoisomerase [Candidatus Enterovibrio escicola]|uniref:DNA topoisomerase n=1 Tax=Candidatus Enterovibrio escicola TaxID=1927127 RepID=UPI0012382524|nr:DNA topoisomerase [Candidatus Enterovibrio escacola]
MNQSERQAFAPQHDKTVIELKAGEHYFKTTGIVEVVKGWRGVLGKDKDKEKDEQSLPALAKGKVIIVSKSELLEKKTTPPKLYTEGTFLTAMCNIAKEVTDPVLKAKLKETAELGTKATRAEMIETFKERSYLETKGKNIVSTPLGKMLILGLPNKLRDPAMTAIWEQQLDEVESGKYSLDKFMSVIEKTVTTYISDFKSGKLIFKLPASTLPKCPKTGCAGFAIEYAGKKGEAFKCCVCETRFKSDQGKVGKEIKKIKKMKLKNNPSLKIS